jgi:hypothetical protein
MALQSELSRRQPQGGAHPFPLLIAQPPGPPRSLPFSKTCQPVGFETVNPILDRARRVPQPLRHLRAGHPLRDQQHAMQTMIVAGLLGTADLVLQSQHDIGGVGNRQSSHVSMNAQICGTRNYL